MKARRKEERECNNSIKHALIQGRVAIQLITLTLSETELSRNNKKQWPLSHISLSDGVWIFCRRKHLHNCVTSPLSSSTRGWNFADDFIDFDSIRLGIRWSVKPRVKWQASEREWRLTANLRSSFILTSVTYQRKLFLHWNRKNFDWMHSIICITLA